MRAFAAGSEVAFRRRDEVIGFAGLHSDFVKAAFGVGLVGCVGDQVLIAQFLGDEVVDRFEVVFLAGFVSVAPGALGNLQHDLLSVDAGVAGAASTPAAAA